MILKQLLILISPVLKLSKLHDGINLLNILITNRPRLVAYTSLIYHIVIGTIIRDNNKLQNVGNVA